MTVSQEKIPNELSKLVLESKSKICLKPSLKSFNLGQNPHELCSFNIRKQNHDLFILYWKNLPLVTHSIENY
jgi:hypothetical protein